MAADSSACRRGGDATAEARNVDVAAQSRHRRRSLTLSYSIPHCPSDQVAPGTQSHVRRLPPLHDCSSRSTFHRVRVVRQSALSSRSLAASARADRSRGVQLARALLHWRHSPRPRPVRRHRRRTEAEAASGQRSDTGGHRPLHAQRTPAARIRRSYQPPLAHHTLGTVSRTRDSVPQPPYCYQSVSALSCLRLRLLSPLSPLVCGAALLCAARALSDGAKAMCWSSHTASCCASPIAAPARRRVRTRSEEWASTRRALRSEAQSPVRPHTAAHLPHRSWTASLPLWLPTWFRAQLVEWLLSPQPAGDGGLTKQQRAASAQTVPASLTAVSALCMRQAYACPLCCRRPQCGSSSVRTRLVTRDVAPTDRGCSPH